RIIHRHQSDPCGVFGASRPYAGAEPPFKNERGSRIVRIGVRVGRKTAAPLLSHKHPEDVEEYRRNLDRVIISGESFTFRHRILDLEGDVRSVITVGEAERSETGEVVALTGYLLDMTETIREDASTLAREVFEQAQEHRANIDQAKGALMVAYGLTDEEAFAVLRWHAQHANLKLRDLAAEMMHRMSMHQMAPLPARATLAAVLAAITEQGFVIPPDPATP